MPAPGQAKPTVVLVHGAWADASSWSCEVATPQAAGYDAGDSEPAARPDHPLGISRRLPQGHRLGGARGALLRGSRLTNAAAGLANVKALVYVDASAPAPGEATAGAAADVPSFTGEWDAVSPAYL
jgi:pimeloyl-ACP methyl ester carboxylesterase